MEVGSCESTCRWGALAASGLENQQTEAMQAMTVRLHACQLVCSEAAALVSIPDPRRNQHGPVPSPSRFAFGSACALVSKRCFALVNNNSHKDGQLHQDHLHHRPVVSPPPSSTNHTTRNPATSTAGPTERIASTFGAVLSATAVGYSHHVRHRRQRP